MPNILNELSFFQFDNLIRNRIPFLILNLGVDLKDFFKLPLYQNHLESLSIPASLDSILIELEKRKIPHHDAIVVLCPNGNLSAQAVDTLEKAGYSNVFYAKNGFDELKEGATH